jgi:hypothetical protein
MVYNTPIWSLSPMEQYEIYNLLSLNLTLNNVIFYLLLVITMSISNIGSPSIVSSWWGIYNESLYRTILTMIEDFLGKDKTVYFPLIRRGKGDKR